MTQAIFLSYSSDDANAARRICEALRAAGLEVWFDQSGGYNETRVYRRESLPVEASIEGPAIIQELSSATVVPPGAHALIDPFENILLTIRPA